jgi:hypothetical protein
LREEHTLKVFENRVLRRIFGPKRDEATGEWRRLHNEELYDLYSSLNIILVFTSRRMRWVGHVACMGERRDAYKVLICKLDGKRPSGRCRSRRENNIRIEGKEIKWEGVDWIYLAQDRDKGQAVLNMTMNFLVP